MFVPSGAATAVSLAAAEQDGAGAVIAEVNGLAGSAPGICAAATSHVVCCDTEPAREAVGASGGGTADVVRGGLTADADGAGRSALATLVGVSAGKRRK